jgi:hypothetical protein
MLKCGRNWGSDKTDPYLAEYHDTGASGNNGDFIRYTPEIPICMFAERNRTLCPLIIRAAPRQGSNSTSAKANSPRNQHYTKTINKFPTAESKL